MQTKTIKYVSLEDIKAIAQQIGEQTGTKHIQEIHITISPVTPEGEAGPVKVEVISMDLDQWSTLDGAEQEEEEYDPPEWVKQVHVAAEQFAGTLRDAFRLDGMLLKAEAAAGMQDGFPVNSALVEEETLILK